MDTGRARAASTRVRTDDRGRESPRTLVLAGGGSELSQDEIERQMAEDMLPDMTATGRALNEIQLDGSLARVPGVRGRVLRRLPVAVAELWLRRDEVDVVLTWGERSAFPAAALMSLLGRRRPGHIAILMWPFDESSPSRLKRMIKRRVLPRLARRGIDRFCVMAPLQRRLVLERWRIPAEHIVPVRYAVDTRFWRPSPGAGDTICSVGREMRDYSTLLDALGTLEVPCHIAVGASPWNSAYGSDDPRAQNVAGKSLPANVTAGPLTHSELRGLYARSRFVVIPILPSETDNGTTAVLEAMAMERPVISTATSGRSDVLEDGVNCILVPPCDPAALRGAIEDLWNDPEKCRRLGAAARAKVVTEHGIDQWLAGLTSAAQELNDSGRPR